MGDTRECRTCGQAKPLTEYYPLTKGGRRYYARQCKVCTCRARHKKLPPGARRKKYTPGSGDWDLTPEEIAERAAEIREARTKGIQI